MTFISEICRLTNLDVEEVVFSLLDKKLFNIM